MEDGFPTVNLQMQRHGFGCKDEGGTSARFLSRILAHYKTKIEVLAPREDPSEESSPATIQDYEKHRCVGSIHLFPHTTPSRLLIYFATEQFTARHSKRRGIKRDLSQNTQVCSISRSAGQSPLVTQCHADPQIEAGGLFRTT